MNIPVKSNNYGKCCAEEEKSSYATFEKKNVARYAEQLGADERALADAYAVAAAAVGWEPPPLIQHAVTQALRDGLSPSGAVTLLSLLRAYDLPRSSGG